MFRQQSSQHNNFHWGSYPNMRNSSIRVTAQSMGLHVHCAWDQGNMNNNNNKLRDICKSVHTLPWSSSDSLLDICLSGVKLELPFNHLLHLFQFYIYTTTQNITWLSVSSPINLTSMTVKICLRSLMKSKLRMLTILTIVAASSMLALALDCWRDSRDISPHLKLAMCDNTMEGDQNNNL